MPADAPQDPCRQWLGIDAADLGDHRRVLGVTPDERDPLAVLRAAEAKLARLRAVSAGPLEFVRAGFVKRVEAARESVLAEIAAAGPAEGASGFRVPPPPAALAGRKPSVPPPVPLVSPPPVPTVPTVRADEPPSAGDAAAPIAIRTAVYRRKTPMLGVMLLMVGLSVLAGWLAYYSFVIRPQRAAQGERRTASRREADTDREQATRAAVPGSQAAVVPQVDEDRPGQRPRRRRTRSADEATTAASEPTATGGAVPAGGRDGASIPGTGQPAMESAVADESGRLDVTLREVLGGMREKRDIVVDKLLAALASRAASVSSRQRVAAWQRLAVHYRRFLDSREASLDAVEPGTSYDVQGQKVVVEKIGGGMCVYRAAGASKSVLREKIPAGIVLAIVAKWFGDDPERHLAVAAYQLVRQEPELRLAEEALEKARDAGADVEAWLPLLEDPVLTAAARE